MIPILPLVSLELARFQVKEEEENDQKLLARMQIASRIVMEFCKLTEIPEEWIIGNESPPEEVDTTDQSLITTSDSPPDYIRVPGKMQQAVLLIIAETWDKADSECNVLSDTVVRLLTHHRDPTFA